MKLNLYPTKTTNLREALESEGFRFPCGGKGLCGRCRIAAPSLAPTMLDKRFFSAEDIERGMRVACDKTFDKPIQIDCFMEKAPKARKLYEPSVSAILGDITSEIAIIEDGKIIESVVLPSPEAEIIALRSLVGKNAVELYEKFGVAKATVILVAGTPDRMKAFCGASIDVQNGLDMGDTLSAADFDMPSEDVYLPPFADKHAGSLELLELDDLPQESMLLHCGGDYTFLYKGETLVATSGFAPDKDADTTAKAVVATLAYFVELYSPAQFYIVGKLPRELAEYLKNQGVVWEQKESAATERAAAAITDNRNKTRLNKLCRKVSALELAEDERWQQLLSSF